MLIWDLGDGSPKKRNYWRSSGHYTPPNLPLFRLPGCGNVMMKWVCISPLHNLKPARAGAISCAHVGPHMTLPDPGPRGPILDHVGYNAVLLSVE